MATPATRLFGYFIDWVIRVVIFTLAAGSIGSDSIGGALFGLILLIGYLILLLYFMSKSTSIGKRILGLKVYKKDTEKPLGFFMMLIREVIGKAISGLIFCLGFLWILFDKNNQGWHDKLVGSIVRKAEVSVEDATKISNTTVDLN